AGDGGLTAATDYPGYSHLASHKG
ncbi:hypothetical protein PMI32_02756, partial [Pseudomonas sp. GM60]